jgi:hypothetical protein
MLKRKGKLALHSTILSGNIDLIKDLLKDVIDINQEDGRKNTPLHVAAMKGYTEIIKILLKKGANPNLKNKHNSVPLHVAVQLNHIDSAMVLIKSGSDVNVKDRYSETPLHFAVSNDSIKLTKSLVEAGAKVNLTNARFFTALAVAKRNKNAEISDYLESEGGISASGVSNTSKIAFKSANIYRKIFVVLFSSVVIGASIVATMMSEGRLVFSFLVALIASIGFAIICFEKPYSRIRNLESKILNGLMTREEVNTLLFSKEISIKDSDISSDKFTLGKAINDNSYPVKPSSKADPSKAKVINHR